MSTDDRGYWLIQAKSKQEAVQWASRCPAADGDVMEVRQVYELSGFVGSTESIPLKDSPEANPPGVADGHRQAPRG